MTALVSKIAKAALDVGGKLSADKTNTEQRYDYLSADKILSVCGQALFSQGIAIIPELASQDTTIYEYTDQYGKAKKRYDSHVAFNFHISDGETTLDQLWFGAGSDYSVPDKALYKAITSGHKYFLMKLLCVGAGNEDGEHEGEEDDKKTIGKKPAPQASKPVDQKPAQPSGNGNGEHAPMSLQEAMAFKTKPTKEHPESKAYGDLTGDELQNMSIGLGKVQNRTPEQDDKLLAIGIILQARAKANKPA